jgi:hypothetical protein
LKEIAMKFAPCVLAAVLAVTAAGCAEPYYGSTRYGYTPQYAYAYPSSDRYYGGYYGSDHGYTSKWDYYRNYQGNVKPGPEVYP